MNVQGGRGVQHPHCFRAEQQGNKKKKKGSEKLKFLVGCLCQVLVVVWCHFGA